MDERKVGVNMTNDYGQLRNVAEIGDLVHVLGYGDRVYQVEGYSRQIDYTRDRMVEDIIYDLTDVHEYDFIVAFQDDVTVVCRNDKADEYLAKLGPVELSDTQADIINGILDSYELDGYEYVEETTIETTQQREEANPMRDKPMKYNREVVDDMLTEISDKRQLQRMFGDDDGEYQKRIDELKQRLKATTEGNY